MTKKMKHNERHLYYLYLQVFENKDNHPTPYEKWGDVYYYYSIITHYKKRFLLAQCK